MLTSFPFAFHLTLVCSIKDAQRQHENSALTLINTGKGTCNCDRKCTRPQSGKINGIDASLNAYQIAGREISASTAWGSVITEQVQG